MDVIQLWWLSLAIAAVVIVVVAVLLGMIVLAAKRVDRHAGDIWTVGKQIAGNTVSIWILAEVRDDLLHTNEALKKLEQRAGSLNETLSGPGGTKG